MKPLKIRKIQITHHSLPNGIHVCILPHSCSKSPESTCIAKKNFIIKCTCPWSCYTQITWNYNKV